MRLATLASISALRTSWDTDSPKIEGYIPLILALPGLGDTHTRNSARRVKVAPGAPRFTLGLREGFTGDPAMCRITSGREQNWVATKVWKLSQGIPGGGFFDSVPKSWPGCYFYC